MTTLVLNSMAEAPRGGGTHIIGVTNWDQNRVIAWDGRAERWRHGHGPNDLDGDDYYKGWLPYHGEELWPHQQELQNSPSD